jgi:hypothetical protein
MGDKMKGEGFDGFGCKEARGRRGGSARVRLGRRGWRGRAPGATARGGRNA